MKQRRGRTGFWALAATVLATLTAAAMLLPATGSAATVYPATQNARTFDNSTGGWNLTFENTGPLSGFTCGTILGTLLCPTLQETHIEDEGNPGGFLNAVSVSQTGIPLLGLAGVDAVWTSPPFEYIGDAGKAPGQVAFRIDKNVRTADLISTLSQEGGLDFLNQTRLSVHLVNDDRGTTHDLVVGGNLAPSTGWETLNAVVPASNLPQIGDEYHLEVRFGYDGLAGIGLSVLPQMDLGVDNVTLTATSADNPGDTDDPTDPGGPGAPGADGDKGASGDKGRDGASGAVINRRILRRTVARQLPRRARVAHNGRWIRIPVRCPKKFNKRCVFKTVAKFNRKSPRITRVKRRAVARGTRKSKALFVKRPYRAKVKRAKRVFVTQVVRVGKVQVRVNRNVRLVRR